MTDTIKEQTVSTKKLLMDVTILRPLAIILLVIMHSFTMYNGSWEDPIGFEPIVTYKWIARICGILNLELFVCLAGYVFAYQQIIRNKNFSAVSVIKGKFKRLIIPSIAFSIVYFFCFGDKNLSLGQIFINIINGCGHMWFLPMLFWCFILGYILSLWKIKDWIKMGLLSCLVVFSFLPLPLRLNSACYFLFFFYLGYTLLKYREAIFKFFLGYRKLTLIFILFLLLYSLQYTIFGQYEGEGIFRIIHIVFLKYIKLLYTALIIIFTFTITNRALKQHSNVPKYIIDASGICYGVYIFHQFILIYLYYHTNLSVLVGAYWLPIVGFAIAFMLSVIATKISLKSRLGRFLIG